MNISEEDRVRILVWASRHPDIKAVYLFGSRARGDNRLDSDIDLALVMRPTEDKDAYNVWRAWHDAYQKNPDLHLSHQVQLEWYEKGCGLEIVGPAVEREGMLLYSV
jgi:predicted nucleotidyltransferase